MNKVRFIRHFLGGIKQSLRRNLSLFLFRFVRDKNHIKVSNLKNCHQGKRAFIVCNGPSLKVEDLDKIHANGDIAFASNKIDRIFPMTSWRPTYYLVMDAGYQYTLLKTMQKVPAKAKIFRDESYYVTCRAKGNCLWMKTDGSYDLLDNPRFSENADEIIYTIGTVTYAMLQMAVHMGIREIYIIGCDNSYGKMENRDGTVTNTGSNSYFKGADKKDQSVGAAVWQMDIAYDYARKYGDLHNIRIYNATRGGHLEAFQRVDFDGLF